MLPRVPSNPNATVLLYLASRLRATDTSDHCCHSARKQQSHRHTREAIDCLITHCRHLLAVPIETLNEHSSQVACDSQHHCSNIVQAFFTPSP